MNLGDSLKRLSQDLSNLLENGQAFSDVAFTVQGRNLYAHKCVLAARSKFFRMVLCSNNNNGASGGGASCQVVPLVIPVAMVSYEVFKFVLQFLYAGQLSFLPSQSQGGPSTVMFALEALHAAQVFGIEDLFILVQEELALLAEKSSIEDAMRILVEAHRQDLVQLWSVCSKLIAKSGLSSESLRKHLPGEIVTEIETIRQRCGYYHHPKPESGESLDEQRTRRLHKALDSSDVELVKLMVMEEGLSLDRSLAVHYAVANCSRKVVKILLELGAADVNATDVNGRSPLHVAAEMADPDMMAVLLEHHADPRLRTPDGTTALNMVRSHAFKALTVEAPVTSPERNARISACLELLQTHLEASEAPGRISRCQAEDDQHQVGSCLVAPEQLGGVATAGDLLEFYQRVGDPGTTRTTGHSPCWSENEEVIDPAVLIVPSPPPNEVGVGVGIPGLY